jgi:hypothetical protein
MSCPAVGDCRNRYDSSIVSDSENASICTLTPTVRPLSSVVWPITQISELCLLSTKFVGWNCELAPGTAFVLKLWSVATAHCW